MKGKMLLIKHKIKTGLISDIRQLIESARGRAAAAVNVELTLLYWRIGQRIRKEVLGENRAGYGEEIIATLSTQLAPLYGEGFGIRNIFRMLKFAEYFPNDEIVTTLSAQLNWSHFVEL